jgi:lactate dehydrogenase-like 2-hydroxyacid dehydrogenase
MSGRHVVVIGELPPAIVDMVQVEHNVVVMTREELSSPASDSVLAEAAGMLVTGQAPIDQSLLARCPALRVVSLRAVGYDKVDLAACAARNVIVCNTPRVLDGAVADLTVLLLLASARRLPANLEAGAGGWARSGIRPELGFDVRGRVLGIYGMGRIGSLVARKCATAFGMNVIYHNRSGTVPSEVGQWVPRDELFQRADFLSIHTPLTSETRHSVGAPELALMPNGAVLINTSRGEVVDQDALVSALEGGHLGGAALDVATGEPLAPEHPLCRNARVMITPHVGSATAETRHAMATMAARNLLAVLRGAAPESRVA